MDLTVVDVCRLKGSHDSGWGRFALVGYDEDARAWLIHDNVDHVKLIPGPVAWNLEGLNKHTTGVYLLDDSRRIRVRGTPLSTVELEMTGEPDRQIVDLQEKLEDAQGKVKSLAHEIVAKQDRISALEANVRHLEASFRIRNENPDPQVTVLQEQLIEARERNRILAEQLNDLNNRIGELVGGNA